MELLKTWGVPSGALIIWLGLVFSLIPIAMKYLRVKNRKSAGALKSLIRIVILGLVALIILDRLNVTITPFLACMGIEIPFPIRTLEFKAKPESLSLPDTGPP